MGEGTLVFVLPSFPFPRASTFRVAATVTVVNNGPNSRNRKGLVARAKMVDDLEEDFVVPRRRRGDEAREGDAEPNPLLLLLVNDKWSTSSAGVPLSSSFVLPLVDLDLLLLLVLPLLFSSP